MDRVDVSLIALRRILRATELYGRELAQAAGLTSAQFRVLQIVAENGSVTPTAVATRMGITQATVTSLITKLEAHGMIVRHRSESDRRQTNIEVTGKGRYTVEHAPDALQQRFVREFNDLADWEQAQLIASLEKVASMLGAERLDASPVLSVGEIHDGAKANGKAAA